MRSAATLIKRLRTLIISRLFIATFLLFYAQFVFPAERALFYAIIVVISTLSIVYVLWLITAQKLHFLAYIQIGCDLFLESALVYYTGGADSLFATVYVLSILSAGSILSPIASFYIATGSSICFVTTVFLDYIWWVPPGFPLSSVTSGARRDVTYLFYASYVRVTVFFLVAILTYFFSQMIQKLEGRVKTQERLVFLGEVISNIAHEIRNPLASISGSVELILKQAGSQLNEKQQKLMSAVVDESERIKRIFSGLLDYSRPSVLRMEEVSVTPFIDQIFMLMQHQDSFNPRVKIEPLYRRQDIKMKVDPEHMKQVLMNVITNAFQAMPNGGCLKVDADANSAGVNIFLEDNGCGMDKKTLDSLFIPFKTTKLNGTGLGLAQAYKVVTQHDGQLSFQSRKGKGTRVEIFIPKT